MSIWNWQQAFDLVAPDFQISLGEADTPILRSRYIGPQVGLKNLYFKIESANPTGSFKDRYAALAISHMLAKQQTKCLATSSGNAGAALAAYCALANIECYIAVAEDAPTGKLQQMLAYGATLHRIEGFGMQPETTQSVFDVLESAAAADNIALQISAFRYSPLGMDGLKSLSYELQSQLPHGIDHVFCQAGGGGLALGVAQGFLDIAMSDDRYSPPKIHIVQPEGNDTIASALRFPSDSPRAVDCWTRISGLQVASVVDGAEAVAACRKTDGNGFLVNDDTVWECQRTLAEAEGIFCEPAGGVSVMGAITAFQMGQIKADDVVVCPITGSGFKDSKSVSRMNKDRDCSVLSLEKMQQLLVQ